MHALLVLASLASALEPPAPTPTVETTLARARRGDAIWLAVRFDVPDGWHLYWENPGESGMPTTLEVRNAEGYAAGPTLYPGPTRLVLPGPIVNYGYADDVTLLARLDPVGGRPPVHPPTATVEVRWLLCKDLCIPGMREIQAPLARLGKAERATVALALEALPEVVPRSAFPLPVPPGATVDVFPSTVFEKSGATVLAPVEDDRVTLAVTAGTEPLAGFVLLRLASPEGVRYVQVELLEPPP